MVSSAERERRHARLRAVMEQEGYSALLIPGNAEATQRGYLRYVSDWRLWGGRGFVLLPQAGEPVLILGAGSQSNWAKTVGWVTDVRAATDVLATVGEIVAQRGLARETIGVPGMQHVLIHGDALRLQSVLPDVQWVNATAPVDAVMAVKSAEEIEGLAHTSACIVRALDVLKENFAPGRTELEVMATASHVLAEQGCLDGIAHLSTEIKPFFHPPTTRQFTEDDLIKVSLEFAGPTGYWIELSGVYSFKAPPERSARYHATVRKAIGAVQEMLRPGVTGGDVTRTIEETIRGDGWKITGRGLWDGHLIGLNVIRPPYGEANDTNRFEENMVFNIHPGLLVDEDGLGMFVQDNLVVTPEGGKQVYPASHEWHIVGRTSTET